MQYPKQADNYDVDIFNSNFRELAGGVISLDTGKFDKTEAQRLFKDVSINSKTGIITFTCYDGSVKTIDTLLEKVAVNFDFDADAQSLIITMEDGTEKSVDLSAFITQIEFINSETIAFMAGAGGTISAIVKEGSIQESHLDFDYLADIKAEEAKAEASAASASESKLRAEEAEATAVASAATAVQKASLAEESSENAERNALIADTKASEAEDAAARAKEDADRAAEYAGKFTSSIDIPITLTAAGWGGDAAPYIQTLPVQQMREDMIPLYLLENWQDDNEKYAYNLILGCRAGHAEITFYAAQIPEVDIGLILKGIPGQTTEWIEKVKSIDAVLSSKDFHSHNSRGGKVLTDSYSYEDILAMTADEDFSDIWIGDIIERDTPAISVTNFEGSARTPYVIIGIDSLKNYGDTPVLQDKPHLVLIPLYGLGSAYINASNVTTGGYKNSYMNGTVMPAVTAALESAFGVDQVLRTREYITNTTSEAIGSRGCLLWKGATIQGEWSDQKAILMTELEAYGSTPFSSSAYDNIGLNQMFPGMKNDWIMNRRINWWLRSVCNSTGFCLISANGIPYSAASSSLRVVRPRFVIGG